jgi:hypothetical protein
MCPRVKQANLLVSNLEYLVPIMAEHTTTPVRAAALLLILCLLAANAQCKIP